MEVGNVSGGKNERYRWLGKQQNMLVEKTLTLFFNRAKVLILITSHPLVVFSTLEGMLWWPTCELSTCIGFNLVWLRTTNGRTGLNHYVLSLRIPLHRIGVQSTLASSHLPVAGNNSLLTAEHSVSQSDQRQEFSRSSPIVSQGRGSLHPFLSSLMLTWFSLKRLHAQNNGWSMGGRSKRKAQSAMHQLQMKEHGSFGK